MTPEEAGQIILEGKPFMPCGACEGEGRVMVEIRTEHNQGRPMQEVETYLLCTHCDSSGKVLRLDYHNACMLLGKPLPAPPPRVVKRPNQAKSLAPTLKSILDAVQLVPQTPNMELKVSHMPKIDLPPLRSFPPLPALPPLPSLPPLKKLF